jgi:uncharacterized FAD-dependent dehydrogenase
MFVYQLLQFPIPPGEKAHIKSYLQRKLKLPAGAELRVERLSLDSRRNRPLRWICNARITSAQKLRHRDLQVVKRTATKERPALAEVTALRFSSTVRVIGAGPAGLWAALSFARRGYQVVLHEQGKAVEERFRDIRFFVKQGLLDEHSNVLFGEGGAGAFSDGKLTSRTRNEYTQQVLQDLADAGAGEEVTYLTHAHLGTDRLQFLVRQIRKWIIELGGEVRFSSCLEDLDIQDGDIQRIKTSDKGWEGCETLVLATGHSSRSVYEMLRDRGVLLEQKNFAAGVRAEHPQDWLNHWQYDKRGSVELLGSAEYTLKAPAHKGQAGAYSFCMCPGGVLLPCASEKGQVATNGMSYSKRNAPFANSGLIVPVDPAGLAKKKDVLAGLDWQRDIEKRAFAMGGGNYGAPAQTIESFLEKRVDRELPKSSFPRDLYPVDLHELFPAEISLALENSLQDFDRKIKGYIAKGLLVAPETRTSSPVRVVRNPKTLESLNVRGLFPLGEGAGYAGGIVSSAADGVRLASLAPNLKKKEERHV